MRYTIAFADKGDRANISAVAGAVIFNGRELPPHEAEILAEALQDCATRAEEKAEALKAGCRAAAEASKLQHRAQLAAFAAA